MKLYLAGPMRGIPKFNRPLFDSVATDLRGAGHAVVSPIDLDLAAGVPLDDMDPSADIPLEPFMQRDFEAIDECTALVLLPGWQRSEGACKELRYAASHHKAVFSAHPRDGRWDLESEWPPPKPPDKDFDWTPAEPEDALTTLSAMMRPVLADGGRKRQAGTKPNWKIDHHRASLYRHLARWEDGEQVDDDSGAHPLVHLAARALMIAWQETE